MGGLFRFRGLRFRCGDGDGEGVGGQGTGGSRYGWMYRLPRTGRRPRSFFALWKQVRSVDTYAGCSRGVVRLPVGCGRPTEGPCG